MGGSLGELEAQIDKKPEAKAEPSADLAPPEPPVTPPEPPAGEIPPVVPEKPDRILPHRISVDRNFSDVEQEAIALAKSLKDAGEDVPSLKDRIELVEIRRAREAAARPPEPETDKELAELDAQLSTTEAEKTELVKSLGIEEYDAKQAELAELRAKKDAILNREHQKETAQQQAARAALGEAIELAKTKYPSSRDEGSEHGQEIQARIAEIQKLPPNHADRALLRDPLRLATVSAHSLAERLAAEHGTTLGAELDILMGADKPKGAGIAAPVTTPTRKPTPAGGAASTPPLAPPAKKPLDMSSPESFDLAVLEKEHPTPKINQYTRR